MTKELLEELKKITPEEQQILNGNEQINKDAYMHGETDIVDARKLLETGKLIQVRTHTRFVRFPTHTHNYIEVIYMCAGTTRHIIDGQNVDLKTGELLFLNQHAKQEILPASENDIAVNLIILPEFFNYTLRMIGEEKNLLRDFVVDSLIEEHETSGYIHFKVADVLPIQNLMENLIWSLWNRQPNRRSINQATMGLLFLHLMNYMDRIETNAENPSQKLMLEVLAYIEEHYRDGCLQELADLLHYDIYWLSREIKAHCGKNYTELVQERRLTQAAYLLETTGMTVLDVGLAIGYENASYFHRIFQKQYGMTPRKYRVMKRQIKIDNPGQEKSE